MPWRSDRPSSAWATLSAPSRQVRHDVAQIEAQRREHLVVARPARVQTPAGRAELLREPGLERGLAILELERDPPLAARMRRTDLAQRVAYCSAVRGGQNSAGVQRLGVRDRGLDVVGHEPIVERVVFARRELEHPAVERRALVPEPRHAAARALFGRRQRLRVGDDERAGAFVREDLGEQRLGCRVGNYVHATHAAANRRLDRACLRQHAVGQRAFLAQTPQPR